MLNVDQNKIKTALLFFLLNLGLAQAQVVALPSIFLAEGAVGSATARVLAHTMVGSASLADLIAGPTSSSAAPKASHVALTEIVGQLSAIEAQLAQANISLEVAQDLLAQFNEKLSQLCAISGVNCQFGQVVWAKDFSWSHQQSTTQTLVEAYRSAPACGDPNNDCDPDHLLKNFEQLGYQVTKPSTMRRASRHVYRGNPGIPNNEMRDSQVWTLTKPGKGNERFHCEFVVSRQFEMDRSNDMWLNTKWDFELRNPHPALRGQGRDWKRHEPHASLVDDKGNFKNKDQFSRKYTQNNCNDMFGDGNDPCFDMLKAYFG